MSRLFLLEVANRVRRLLRDGECRLVHEWHLRKQIKIRSQGKESRRGGTSKAISRRRPDRHASQTASGCGLFVEKKFAQLLQTHSMSESSTSKEALALHERQCQEVGDCLRDVRAAGKEWDFVQLLKETPKHHLIDANYTPGAGYYETIGLSRDRTERCKSSLCDDAFLIKEA